MLKWFVSVLVLCGFNSAFAHTLVRPTAHSNTPRVVTADAQTQWPSPQAPENVDGKGGSGGGGGT